MNDYIARVVTAFRETEGETDMLKWPAILLTTKGRRSGEWRTVPVGFRDEGDRIVVLAAANGSDKHPAWYLNLLADPHVQVEIRRDDGLERFDALASVADGEEREREWAEQMRLLPRFGDYQKKTDRPIPVVVLTPDSEGAGLA